MKSTRARALALSLAVSLGLAPAIAAADPPAVKDGPDPAAAQTLFYDARNLMKQGKFADACPKLEESLRLDEGIGTRFNLADCHEHVGKIATAWAGFLEVAGKARAAKQADREKIARQRAQALEARLPKLVVEVEPPAPAGLEVKRDGVVVGPAVWGTPIPVDPGAHAIVASAPGKQAWESHVQTPESKVTRVVVPRDLPAAPVAAAPPATPATPASPPATSAAAPPAADGAAASQAGETQVTNADALRGSFPPPERDDSGSAQRTIGWGVGTIGVAGLAVGGAFGIVSLNKRDSARSHCDASNVCDGTGVGLRDDAIRAGNIATVTAIGGGVALALGAVLILTSPSPREPAHAGSIRAVPSVAKNGGGISIQGSLP